ncbi:hypothetical protein GCM10010412_023900 [Nonomuraea recticatena]|uniref:Uncharacterized protein n=1 Tax=Nonomuraea recticatena TaxID=46178 RepID=A0ABN3RKK0_9ACTN
MLGMQVVARDGGAVADRVLGPQAREVGAELEQLVDQGGQALVAGEAAE